MSRWSHRDLALDAQLKFRLRSEGKTTRRRVVNNYRELQFLLVLAASTRQDPRDSREKVFFALRKLHSAALARSRAPEKRFPN